MFDHLPQDVRAKDTRLVYYGKPGKSLDQLRLHASRIFSYGRETRGTAHHDVWKHLKGMNQSNHGISGFMQNGKDRKIIERKYVLGQQSFAALYVIDSQGAEILDVDAFSACYGLLEPENGDGEILFSGCLPPTRILGDGLYSSSDGLPCLVEVLANPNYRSCSRSER